jgi:hypothetical protein
MLVTLPATTASVESNFSSLQIAMDMIVVVIKDIGRLVEWAGFIICSS